MPTKYTVNLTAEERYDLDQLTRQGILSARKLKRAQILLLADEGHDDATIAQMLHVGESTVHRIRQRCVEEGLAPALSERPRRGGQRKLDGNGEAFLVATACSDPPAGRQRWTMQLLADRWVAVEMVESISDETVRKTLKKTPSSLGSKSSGVSQR
jgi:transposase